MEVTQLWGAGFLTLVLCLVLQQYHSPMAPLVVMAFGALVWFYAATQVQPVILRLARLTDSLGVSSLYLSTLCRMVGLAWLTEFLCQLCRDAGQSALAVKVECGAKIAILVLFFPVLASLLEQLAALV